MKKHKFDPRSVIGMGYIEAAGEAFIHQTHSFRVIKEDGNTIELDEEELDIKDPKCYDIELTKGRISFVHVREYNEHKVQR